jgi:hypothetical protein
MATGFHAHTHPHALASEVLVELLGLFLVFRPLLAQFARVGVHVRNLPEAQALILEAL